MREVGMLGDLLGESSGTITGARVLKENTGYAGPKIEVSIRGRGRILGVDITDVGTYVQEVRPGGFGYGEGHLVLLADDGESALWTGAGTGPASGMVVNAAVSGTIQTTSQGPLGGLNNICTAIEFQSDAEGRYRWRLWHWKPSETTIVDLAPSGRAVPA
jgi:hypothetical protein